MKKILSIIMVLVLMVSISSLALADEAGEEPVVDLLDGTGNGENETEIDDDTEEEIEIMNNTLGSEIRLLQLEKAITKNLLKGEMTVEVLKGMGYNTSDLEAILSEMRFLLEEVQAANATDDDAVQQFVDLKSDARKLTKQFRESVKNLLSDEKIKNIREQIKNMTSLDLQNCSKNIQNRIKQFNRNQIHRLYGIIGEANNSLVNEYMNGTISVTQAKMQICKMVNMKTKEKKNEIFSTLKREKIRNKGNANIQAENSKLYSEQLVL